jgi:hypothetical protein
MFSGSMAFGDNLIPNQCANIETNTVQITADSDFNENHLFKISNFYTNSNFLTCKQIDELKEAFTYISIALLPVSSVAAAPGVREALLASATELGLVAGSAVTASILVIGGTGLATVYILIKPTLDECEKRGLENVKKEFEKELIEKYQLNRTSEKL